MVLFDSNKDNTVLEVQHTVKQTHTQLHTNARVQRKTFDTQILTTIGRNQTSIFHSS